MRVCLGCVSPLWPQVKPKATRRIINKSWRFSLANLLIVRVSARARHTRIAREDTASEPQKHVEQIKNRPSAGTRNSSKAAPQATVFRSLIVVGGQTTTASVEPISSDTKYNLLEPREAKIFYLVKRDQLVCVVELAGCYDGTKESLIKFTQTRPSYWLPLWPVSPLVLYADFHNGTSLGIGSQF